MPAKRGRRHCHHSLYTIQYTMNKGRGRGGGGAERRRTGTTVVEKEEKREAKVKVVLSVWRADCSDKRSPLLSFSIKD